MLYAQTSSLSKVTAILVGASISSAVSLTKVGKSRACSTVLASFNTASDIHGYFFQLTMQIRDNNQQLNGRGGEWIRQQRCRCVRKKLCLCEDGGVDFDPPKGHFLLHIDPPKGHLLVFQKKATSARDVFLAGSRDSEEFLPLRLHDVGIRGRFQYGICLRFLLPPTFAGTAPRSVPSLTTKKKTKPLADSHCHKKNSSPRKYGSNKTKRSSLNGGESTTHTASN